MASQTLNWTAVGDDSLSGTATKYDMRYKLGVPPPAATDALGREMWWQTAVSVTTMPLPRPAGQPEAVTITPTGGFAAGTYYWVIRTRDEIQSNWSAWSNVAIKEVPLVDVVRPAPITDLLVR